MPAAPALAEIVDLDRYPIDRLDSPEGRALIARCRADLTERAVCELEGFLLPGAVAQVLGAADALAARAWVSDQSHNAYFEPVPDGPGADGDPLAMLQHSSKCAIAYDLLPADLAIRVLYESEAMVAFAAGALGRDVLHRSADPLDALEIAMYAVDQELGWHFDNSEFSITLMLQDAEAGGYFDDVPALRTHDDPNHAGVAAFLGDAVSCGDAVSTGAIRLDPAPGTLSLFQGHLALHRVSPVVEGRTRINAVLTYGDRPGMQLSDLTRQLFYGRLA